jgi:16S rRNA (uracil1498-N3)-methyltransferase
MGSTTGTQWQVDEQIAAIKNDYTPNMPTPPLFFTDAIDEKNVVLTGDDARHCYRVLRLGPGDVIRVTNGLGKLASARIVLNDSNQCIAELSEIEVVKPLSFNIHIGISPLKNVDRFEWFIEKATEIGVTSITPLISTRTERVSIKVERLEKIIVSAVKQSGEYWKPLLRPAENFNTFLEKFPEACRFIAYCEDKPPMHLARACKDTGDVVLLIGPEGDFTPDEIALALEKQYKMVSLGEKRLRTETAGVVALNIIQVVKALEKFV